MYVCDKIEIEKKINSRVPSFSNVCMIKLLDIQFKILRFDKFQAI